MAGGGTDPQGERRLPRHWPCGGDVEGSGSNFKSPAHSIHHLPLIPQWIPGRSRHRYHQPRCQTASAVSGLERGGPVHNIYGTAQGV